jgi:hypothetical protein
MLTNDAEYADLGADYFLQRTGRTRQTRRLVSQREEARYLADVARLYSLLRASMAGGCPDRRRSAGSERS